MWTRDRIEQLGPTTTVKTTAEILGVDCKGIYRAISAETWDVTRVLTIGRAIRIPTSDLIRALYGPVT